MVTNDSMTSGVVITLPTAASAPVQQRRRHGPLPRSVGDIREARRLRAFAALEQKEEQQKAQAALQRETLAILRELTVRAARGQLIGFVACYQEKVEAGYISDGACERVVEPGLRERCVFTGTYMGAGADIVETAEGMSDRFLQILGLT